MPGEKSGDGQARIASNVTQNFCHSKLAKNRKLPAGDIPEIPRKLGMTFYSVVAATQ
jgi:hypothetical protein